MTITRRTALKAMGAALFGPCVTLRQEIDRERLLSAFCCPFRSRYDIEKPFGFGSLTYATDARCICRAELFNRHEDGERILPKNLEELYRNHFAGAGRLVPFELPDWRNVCIKIESPYLFSCPECDNRRVSLGDHYPPEEWFQGREAGDYDYDIDDNTMRDKTCPVCKGRTWRGKSLLMIDGVPLEYARLKPIAALPNVRIARSGYGKGNEAIVFQADGFEGIAMGVNLS